MGNNNIVIDSNKTDIIISRMNDSVSSVNNSVSFSKNMFSSLQNSNTLSKGVNAINDNLSQIANRFDNYKRIIGNKSSEFFEQEKLLSLLVDNIQIPNELEVVDNIFEVNMNEINLSKIDGKAINKDNSVTQISYNDSSIVNKEELKSITNNNTSNSDFNSDYSLNNVVLNNINNNEINQKVEYQDNYEENKANLNQININTQPINNYNDEEIDGDDYDS